LLGDTSSSVQEAKTKRDSKDKDVKLNASAWLPSDVKEAADAQLGRFEEYCFGTSKEPNRAKVASFIYNVLASPTITVRGASKVYSPHFEDRLHAYIAFKFASSPILPLNEWTDEEIEQVVENLKQIKAKKKVG